MNGSTVFSYMGPSMAAAIVAHTANRTADLAILRALYDPRLAPGMARAEVLALLPVILGGD